MVSGSTVNGDASTLSSYLNSYKSSISDLASNWKGASYDNLSSKAEAFVSEFESAIQKEMSAFASACDLYEEYKQYKSELESAKSNYSRAVASGDSSSASSYNSKVSDCESKISKLKSEINSYLQTASSTKLQATSISGTTETISTADTEKASEDTTTTTTTTASSSKVQNALNWAIGIAKDNSHGYSQSTRWGNPNYDCSSLVISAYEQAGIKVKSAGANSTRDMKKAFLKCGFEWIPGDPKKTGTKLQPGDVLLKIGSHTEMYVGNGKNVGAHKNYDGKNGDSRGNEISVQSSSHAWDGILRLKTS